MLIALKALTIKSSTTWHLSIRKCISVIAVLPSWFSDPAAGFISRCINLHTVNLLFHSHCAQAIFLFDLQQHRINWLFIFQIYFVFQDVAIKNVMIKMMVKLLIRWWMMTMVLMHIGMWMLFKRRAKGKYRMFVLNVGCVCNTYREIA